MSTDPLTGKPRPDYARAVREASPDSEAGPVGREAEVVGNCPECDAPLSLTMGCVHWPAPSSPWPDEYIEVRRVLAGDGRMLVVVGPFSGPLTLADSGVVLVEREASFKPALIGALSALKGIASDRTVNTIEAVGWRESELLRAFYPWPVESTELRDWLAPLRGHDLACWCPLDQPCHADVLLELANA